MNIILALLGLFSFILTVIMYMEAYSDSQLKLRNNAVPILTTLVFSVLCITGFFALYHIPYDIEIEIKNKSSYDPVSITVDGDKRTTIENLTHKCKVTYMFNRELVLFDKSNVVEYFPHQCTDKIKENAEIKRIKYLGELNEN